MLTGRTLTGVHGDADGVVEVALDDGRRLPADVVIVAVGVRPNTDLAVQLGAALGPSGAIAVDTSMRTNVPDVYAVGDCAGELLGDHRGVAVASAGVHGQQDGADRR